MCFGPELEARDEAPLCEMQYSLLLRTVVCTAGPRLVYTVLSASQYCTVWAGRNRQNSASSQHEPRRRHRKAAPWNFENAADHHYYHHYYYCMGLGAGNKGRR